MENNDKTISYKLLIIDVLIVIFVVSLFFVAYENINKPEQKNVEKKEIVENSEEFNKLFSSIKAKAVYVFDVQENKVLFKKNETAQLPLASITKLMTALVAKNLSSKNNQVTIKKEFLQEEGDSGLKDGEVWNIRNLVDFSLVVSSNDGARAVASVIGAQNLKTSNYDLGRAEFINKMNEEAKKLGLNQTYFINETGLDEINGQSGGYGSAENIAKMINYILKNNPEIFEATKYNSVNISSLSQNHYAENTNLYVGKIPNLIGSKTGYTNLAGGNLAVVFDSSIGKPVIIVVLGSTQEGRFEDVLVLVNASMNYERN